MVSHPASRSSSEYRRKTQASRLDRLAGLGRKQNVPFHRSLAFVKAHCGWGHICFGHAACAIK